MSVSRITRRHGIQPSQLFKWKKQYHEGSLVAVATGEDEILASEVPALVKQIRELEHLLSKTAVMDKILTGLLK